MPGDAVHDLVDGAVAARGHDALIAFRDGVAREPFRVAGLGGGAENRSPRQLLHLPPQPLDPGAARGWIEDNDGIFQSDSGPVGFSLFLKARRRNFRA